LTARPALSRAAPSKVAALLKKAEVAVNHIVETGKRADTLRLIRLDRNLLEVVAVRGRAMSAYTTRKAALGL
jgi:hypothetical protein